MQRVRFAERPHWRERCEELGFTFHSADGPYWDEGSAYAFTLDQVEKLEAATEELHRLCLAAVEWIVARDHFDPFRLTPAAIRAIKESWRRGDPSLYGRFDFAYDGENEPKLLEYNADTPTGLLEASVVQWHWLQDVSPRTDQFNSLHEKLIDRWRQLMDRQGRPELLHFCSMAGSEEDAGNTLYLMDTAHQAGCTVNYLPVENIGYAQQERCFVDESSRVITDCFKLYPWEWLWQDEFGAHIGEAGIRFYEPPWKLLLSSKAILPILWRLNPGHPNLLAASFNDDLGRPCVRKPIYSREGENIAILNGADNLETPGAYGEQPVIYQDYAPLPEIEGAFPVLGSWIVGEEAAGIGIREDSSPITRDTSRFVPHYFN